jgi:hypothetical protein
MSDHDEKTHQHASPQRPERKWVFDHHRLDAYEIALQALILGKQIIDELPRGYGTMGDQLGRALTGAFLQTTEAAARTGADRMARFRAARGEACEAAGAIEALDRLGVADRAKVDRELELLWRLCAMLTRLARLRR